MLLMKILIIEPCGFMRLGMLSVLADHKDINVTGVENIEEGLIQAEKIKPNIILVNMTSHCHCTETDSVVSNFLRLRVTSKIYCYLDANYPDHDEPIMIAENFLILRKHQVNTILNKIISHTLSKTPATLCTQPFSIFSDQEVLVIGDWMAEMPNYRIARKLNISDRTVYVHKRHITQKIKVRNRLEFCFVYNLIKYFHWPMNPLALRPLSRKIKADIMTLMR